MRQHLAWICIWAGLQANLAGAAAAATDRPQIAPAPDWVLPPLTTEPPAASEAPVQLLVNDQQIRISGEVVEYYSLNRMKVQSPQGLGAVGTLSFSWKPDTDVLTVHQLTATRGGQSRNLLDDGQGFTILRREDQLEQAVLTGMLTAVLQPPGLQVGDVIEMSYTLRRKDPVVADNPDGTYVWPNTSLGSIRLRTLWPENLPVRWRASTHMPAAEPVKRDGWNELTYQMNNPVPLLQPAGAPGRFAALRMLEVTTFRDWAHLSQRMAPLYQKASTLAADSPLRAEVAGIRQLHRTPAARAAAALRLVQDQIRYVLLAMNNGGLVPATADETWQRRFGDCKAKTSLLLALLRELGIEAEPVAVSTGFADGMDARLPAIGLFDHVLVRATIDGKQYWLDGTRTGDRSLARLQPPDFLWALPMVAKGSVLVPIARAPLQEPQVVRTLDIDASQGIAIPAPFKAEMNMTGDAALSLKLAWDRVPAANREESMRGYWREQFPGVEIEGTQNTYDEEQGRLSWKATGTIRMEWDPEYNTYLPHDLGLGYRADFTRARGTDAEAPYLVRFPVYTRTVETVRLPKQREPFKTTGTDIDRTVGGFEYHRKARVENDKFTAEVTERSIAPEFPAAQKGEAERVLLEMSRNDLYLKMPQLYLRTEKELLAQAGQKFDSANDYYRLANEMMLQNMDAPATAILDKVFELDPGHADARIARSMILRRKGDFDGAAADLAAGLAANPDHAGIQERLVALHVQRGETEKAMALLDTLLARAPNALLLTQRAALYRNQGNRDLALRDADAAVTLDAKQFAPFMLKVTILAELGRVAEARTTAATLAVQNGGTETDATILVATLLDDIGDRIAARRLYDEVLAKQPSAESYIGRARVQDDKQSILADVRKGLEQPKVSSSAQAVAGTLLLERKFYREAIELLDLFDEKQPLSFKAMGQRGIARWLLGDKARAAKDFASARDVAPVESGLNTLCWDKGIFNAALDVALKECDEALIERPQCSACMDSRAFVLLRIGRFKDSIEQYDAALRLFPGRPASLYGRGIARIRSGDPESGKQDIAAAKAVNPEVTREFERAGVQP